MRRADGESQNVQVNKFTILNFHRWLMTESCLPDPQTPLYNHPLPQIEQWLLSQGCHQDSQDLHLWRIERPQWQAELWLDIEELSVVYIPVDSNQRDIQRTFKYSLSRQDIEDAVFSGP